jgi:hypothetical protein
VAQDRIFPEAVEDNLHALRRKLAPSSATSLVAHRRERSSIDFALGFASRPLEIGELISVI